MNKEIEIIAELVEVIRYTIPRSNALNKAYHKAKKFLKDGEKSGYYTFKDGVITFDKPFK